MTDDGHCPLCDNPATPSGDRLQIYGCTTCGKYALVRREVEMCLHRSDPFDTDTRWQLSALLREREIQGLDAAILQLTDYPIDPGKRPRIHFRELLAKWPRTVPQQLDRALLNLGRLSKRIGSKVELEAGGKPGRSDVSVLFARDKVEADGVLGALVELGLILSRSSDLPTSVRIRPEGWSRIADLERVSSIENPAFIAMWFGGDQEMSLMDRVEEEIRAGVQDAGYLAETVKTQEHNQNILDRIMAMLNGAPFVVADFTGGSKGVYYEAGVGRGQKKLVVHCCRRRSFEEDVHFDLKHENFLLWDDPDELREGVCNRILADFGRGPHGLEAQARAGG